MTAMPDYLAVEIGHAGDLNVKSLRNALKNTLVMIERVSPLTAIDIAIGGYDDDPREIFEIPEARHFVLDFAAGLMRAGIPIERFLPTTAQLIQLCLATEDGELITVTDEPRIDISDQLEGHRARARRTMN